MKYEILPHPTSKRHLIFKVSTRTRVFACVSAWSPDSQPPTLMAVRHAWINDRTAFQPYNESTGRFIAS